MTTLTKQEIRWLVQLVEKDRDYAKEMMSESERKEDSLIYGLSQLRHDNMQSLAADLKLALLNDAKRIAIR